LFHSFLPSFHFYSISFLLFIYDVPSTPSITPLSPTPLPIFSDLGLKVELHSTDLVCDEAVAEAAKDILLAKDLGIETTPLEKVKVGKGRGQWNGVVEKGRRKGGGSLMCLTYTEREREKLFLVLMLPPAIADDCFGLFYPFFSDRLICLFFVFQRYISAHV